jgi:two-component system CheB/CheR fusion protein
MKKSGKPDSQKRKTKSISVKAPPSSRFARKAGAKPSPDPAAKGFPIVGIGASAGGFEAMKELLQSLPVDTGMALVLVQHLEAKHESMLAKLLARSTEMPVQEVSDGMHMQPNQVYVIPANADLSLVDGVLHVVPRKAPAGRHRPIDSFLRSLAEARGTQAIGVILSGTGSDGTAGLQAIKVEGGITFAQQPESAKYNGMPSSAIAADCVDFVLPPVRLAKQLARIARHPFVRLLPPEAVPAVPAKEEDWARLFRLLRTSSGVDFSSYKKSTIQRRLARRMAVHKIEDLSAYLKLLEGSREELEILFNEILICVTGFFRDADVFFALEEKILPQIMAAKRAGEALRIWVTGCSSGEEAYSIAICVLEYLGEKAAEIPIQIFGTDINEAAIAKARTGVYPADALKEISADRIRRFFTKTNGSYEVNQKVREMCVFSRHDVTKDPPFSKLDLISCRNVLIYFEPVLQKNVLASFHYALKNHGVLLLGKTEGLGAHPDLFTIADRKHKFFLKNAAAPASFEVSREAYEALIPHGKPHREAPQGVDFEKEADRIVWERYLHAGLIVNNDLQILSVRGDTSPYLRLAPGKATFQLLKMLPEELVMEVRAAIQKVRRTKGRVRQEGIKINQGQEARTVNIEVRPLPSASGQERCFLILFEEGSVGKPPPAEPKERRKGKRTRDSEVVRLQNELARKQEYLQDVIRDLESTNEELKSANEEALSSMEEMQSTNEELETTKEELQSSNEELTTLNEQLQTRNAELVSRTDDFTNVFNLSGIPILILGSDRRIRLYTPPAEKVLGLLPGDIGRPIANLRLAVRVPDLEALVLAVIDKGSEIRRGVQSEDGRWYSLRIRPFWTAQKNIEGVLVTFVDVHDLRQSQENLQTEHNFIAAILDAAKDLLVVVLDREGRIVHFNRVCQELTGYSFDDVKGRYIWDFLLVPEETASVRATFQALAAGTPNQRENYWVAKNGRHLLISWSNSTVNSDSGVENVIGTGIDVTEREAARQQAQESEATVRAMMESAAQAILAVNQGGRIVMANPAAERMYGYGAQELMGLALENLMPERYRERHAAHLKEWFAQPRGRPMSTGVELSCLRNDGTEFAAEASLSFITSTGAILGVAFVSDITERKKTERTLADYQQQLQKLTAGLISAQESGNRAIARELHDVFSQELAAVGMEISSLKKQAKSRGDLAGRLADLGKKISGLARDIHRTSRELHPAILEELGLEPALRQECEAFQQRSEIPTKFTAKNVPSGLAKDTALCLYRVAQESLRNIAKHAEDADAVRVSLLGSPEGITLRIEDTGDGFELEEALKKGGLGLISMEERVRLVNGRLTLQSEPGKGTEVTAFVPHGKEQT